jgi:hypothetical protein
MPPHLICHILWWLPQAAKAHRAAVDAVALRIQQLGAMHLRLVTECRATEDSSAATTAPKHLLGLEALLRDAIAAVQVWCACDGPWVVMVVWCKPSSPAQCCRRPKRRLYAAAGQWGRDGGGMGEGWGRDGEALPRWHMVHTASVAHAPRRHLPPLSVTSHARYAQVAMCALPSKYSMPEHAHMPSYACGQVFADQDLMAKLLLGAADVGRLQVVDDRVTRSLHSMKVGWATLPTQMHADAFWMHVERFAGPCWCMVPQERGTFVMASPCPPLLLRMTCVMYLAICERRYQSSG